MTPKRLHTLPFGRQFLAGVLAFGAALLVLSFEARGAEFEGDEADYVATSRYFGYLFIQGDVGREEWGDNRWTRTQPPLTRYVLGAWLKARGYELESLNQPYVSTASSVDVNRRKGRVPDEETLATARQPMVLLGAGAVALLFPLAATVGGPVAGWLTVILALSSPFVRYTLVHAWAEALLSCLLLLSGLVGALGARAVCAGGNPVKWSAPLGLLLGLAGATKLTGLVGVAATLIWSCVAAGLWQVRRESRPEGALPVYTLVWGVTAALIALVVFIAINPFLWRGPVPGVLGMLRERQEEMAAQQLQWPEYAVTSAAQRPLVTVAGGLNVGPWGGSAFGVVLNLGLLLLGLARLATDRRQGVSPPGGWQSTTLLLTWLTTFVVVIGSGLMLSYPRYFLPACLLVLPFCGLGGATLPKAATSLLRYCSTRPREGVVDTPHPSS